LPPICMRCGAPAGLPLVSEFHWCPTWLYYCFPLLPLLVLAAGLSQLWCRVSGCENREWLRALCCYCQLPLCRLHRRRLEVRKLAFVSCLFMLPFICLLCAFFELEGVAFGVTALALWLPWRLRVGKLMNKLGWFTHGAPAEIARRLGVSRSTVCRDLQAIEADAPRSRTGRRITLPRKWPRFPKSR